MWSLPLGKLPPKPLKLKLADYLSAPGLPLPPPVFGNYQIFNSLDWGPAGNLICSDCCFAGFAHQLIMWKAIHGSVAQVSDSQAIGDYSACTGYDPRDPKTDNGTSVADGLAYWKNTGISYYIGNDSFRDYLAGSVQCATTPEALALAAYLFGSVGVGVQLPDSAPEQFAEFMPFTVTTGSKNLGGHYIPIFGRNSKGYFIGVTWGRLTAMSPAWLSAYCDEAAIPLSINWVDHTSLKSPRGISYPQLQQDLIQMGNGNG